MIFDPAQNGGSGEQHNFLHKLLAQDWEQPGGAIEFTPELVLDDLVGAAHFQNVRALLRALAEDDGTLATVTGCFNRAFATRMLGEFHLPEISRESVRRMCKVINEADVPDLHVLRVVCELGGLIARRKNACALRAVAGSFSPTIAPDTSSGICFSPSFASSTCATSFTSATCLVSSGRSP